jgi:hypothetical protein
VCDTITLENRITSPVNATPEWQYVINSSETKEDGTPLRSTTVYCYFPSELGYNEGYLNTHSNSYLLYQAPPNAYIIDSTNKRVEITEDAWNNLLTQQEGQEFPVAQPFQMSCVIMAKQWQKAGTQSSRNSYGLNPNQYLLISKPSASWYVPTSGLQKVSFDFMDHAMENVGSKVSLVLEFFPSRYSYFDSNSTNTWHSWIGGSTRYKQDSMHYSSTDAETPSHKYICNANGVVWTGSFPIKHRLEYWDENENICESFITDDVFSTSIENNYDHNVNAYAIEVKDIKTSEVTKLWEKCIKAIIC